MKETDRAAQSCFHLLIRAITGMIIKASTSSQSMLQLTFHLTLLCVFVNNWIIICLICSQINQPDFDLKRFFRLPVPVSTVQEADPVV